MTQHNPSGSEQNPTPNRQKTRWIVHQSHLGSAAHVAAQAAIDGAQQGFDIHILDLSLLEPPHPHRRLDGNIQHFLYQSARKSPLQSLHTFASANGFKIHYGSDKALASSSFDVERIMDDLPNTFSELLSWQPAESDMGRTVANWLASEIALGVDPSPSKHRKAIKREIQAYVGAKEATLRWLAHACPGDQICVWNGRRPSYQGVVTAGEQMGVEVLFMEGGRRGFFFLENRRPHDRSEIARGAERLAGELTPDERIAVREDFLIGRQQDPRINQFVYLNPKHGNETKSKSRRPSPEPIAAIFTSSVDEVAGLRGWESDGWPSQEAAIKAVSERLQSLGYRVIIKIHPNLSQKSWREIRRLRRAYQSIEAEVVNSMGDHSAYELLAQADVVAVWRSTVGLEAILRGTPVWVLGKTRYDTLCDVRFANDPLEARQETFESYTPESAGGWAMAAYLTLGGSRRFHSLNSSIEDDCRAHDASRGFNYPGRPIARLLDALFDIRVGPRPFVNASQKVANYLPHSPARTLRRLSERLTYTAEDRSV